MTELNDIRDHAWYIRQSHRAANEALGDGDSREALKYRKIALEVMMLPLTRMTAVTTSSINRFADMSGYDMADDRTIAHDVAQLRTAAHIAGELPEENDMALFAHWKSHSSAADATGAYEEVGAGNIALSHDTVRGDNEYTASIRFLARFCLAATAHTKQHSSVAIAQTRFVASAEGISVEQTITPPSRLVLSPVKSLSENIKRSKITSPIQDAPWEELYRREQMNSVH